MVKFTHIFVISILIFWLAVSGCVGDDNNAEEAQEAPGTNGSQNASAEKLTEADLHDFESNVTDLEDLLDNSSEEIVIEKL